jgi:hypothetical protein
MSAASVQSSSATVLSAHPSSKSRGLCRVIFTGAVPHANMPAPRAADIGVALFDEARHPPLQLGFHWSPSRSSAYGVRPSVVAPRLPRSAPRAHETEGLLYDPTDFDGQSARFARSSSEDRRLCCGSRARGDFSWEAFAGARRETAGAGDAMSAPPAFSSSPTRFHRFGGSTSMGADARLVAQGHHVEVVKIDRQRLRHQEGQHESIHARHFARRRWRCRLPAT